MTQSFAEASKTVRSAHPENPPNRKSLMPALRDPMTGHYKPESSIARPKLLRKASFLKARRGVAGFCFFAALFRIDALMTPSLPVVTRTLSNSLCARRTRDFTDNRF
jgi:hypothetical protein